MNRADLEKSLESSGLLTAYTVGATSAATATSDADKSFLTKRNKNQKKREAQKQQAAAAGNVEDADDRKSESEIKEGDEAVDNWEENWDDGESEEEGTTQAPPEFVIDQEAVEERKRQEEIAAKRAAAAAAKEAKRQQQFQKQQQQQQQLHKKEQQQKQSQKQAKPQKQPSQPQHQNEDLQKLQQKEPQKSQQQKEPQKSPKIQSALKDLNSTVEEVTAIFQTMAVKQSPKSSDGSKTDEKSKDEVKAEREAKKKAKLGAKAAAKDKKDCEKESEVVQTAEPEVEQPGKAAAEGKSKEEIKAEREAKKKAKQAARQKGKEDDQNAAANAPKPEQKTATAAAAAPEAGQKSKAELKRERRELQEKQREEKAAAQAAAKSEKESAASGHKESGQKPAKEVSGKKAEKSGPDAGPATVSGKPTLVGSRGQRVPDDIQADIQASQRKMQKNLASQNLPQRPKAQRKVMLFSHLHQYERELSISRDLPVVGCHIHPAIVQLGLQYAEGAIQGSNARCIAFMQAMKRVISDYATPDDRELSRDLDSKLKTHITFLKGCRTHSTSMGNAIRFLKAKIRNVSALEAENEAKAGLIESIDRFVQDINLSAVTIAMTACEKIRDGDVILTYGCSSLLKAVFLRAAESGLKFRVIVADARPKLEGRQMANHLIKAGVHCTYTLVHSLSYVIGEVTKVFLGAHAVFANGHVMSRVGTSQVAMIAKAQNVPVLVCCETYKFSERVRTDSFVFNELGDPDDLVATGTGKVTALEDWRDLSSLNLLYLNYDVTPASLVDAIISEISVIPCTSVPVVLRLKAIDLGH